MRKFERPNEVQEELLREVLLKNKQFIEKFFEEYNNREKNGREFYNAIHVQIERSIRNNNLLTQDQKNNLYDKYLYSETFTQLAEKVSPTKPTEDWDDPWEDEEDSASDELDAYQYTSEELNEMKKIINDFFEEILPKN